jgi:hypothetical protein
MTSGITAYCIEIWLKLVFMDSQDSFKESLLVSMNIDLVLEDLNPSRMGTALLIASMAWERSLVFVSKVVC